ncbi:MAG: glycine cleavage system aminomethyltransferase GcvT [Pseudomonadota bacterium]
MAHTAETTDLLETPLAGRHRDAGARMVPFAGYAMPIQYPLGIMKEHQWTRDSAGLFDVSHMGQAMLVADDGRHETVASALEALVPADILNLKHGRQRYTQLLNANGGILDDLMVTRSTSPEDDGTLLLVVNAACKAADCAHISSHMPPGVRLEERIDRSLIALQGPLAEAALADHAPGVTEMVFMDARSGAFDGMDLHLSRSGYTGEDGFELSIPTQSVGAVWDALVADPRVEPIGLGARDSLRLEAGLCLYGHDIDETTSPVEAGLQWSIQKRRRDEGGFPGAARIQHELSDGPTRRRVGLAIDGRMPVREGAPLLVGNTSVGVVTSGGFGPSVGGPVAMGYVEAPHAAIGSPLEIEVRGKRITATVRSLPFVPARFKR